MMKVLTMFLLLASGVALNLRLPSLPTPRAFTNTKINIPRPAGAAAAAMAAVLLAQTTNAMPAMAADSQRVGSIPASGFIFKDTLDVTSFKDPKVSGITLYVSDFSKPITDRMKGDFFSDPSTASITCIADGPVKLAPNVELGQEGEEVFSEAKSLLFKSVKVRRIVDKDSGNVVYVSFSQKFDTNEDSNKSRFKSSLCAVHITEQ